MSPLKPAVHGFVPKRSIVTIARAHCSRKTRFVLNLVLQDFFTTLTFFRVRGVLENRPFNFSHEEATVIVRTLQLPSRMFLAGRFTDAARFGDRPVACLHLANVCKVRVRAL